MSRWRKFWNLDGPWICLGCGTRTVIRKDGDLRCIGCGLRQCTCDLGGWDGPPSTDPNCEHHGAELRRVMALEEKAMVMSRV